MVSINRVVYHSLRHYKPIFFYRIKELILDNKENFNPNYKVRGISILSVAAEQGLMYFVKLFVKMGADVNVINTNNTTALYCAMQGGYYEIAKYLLRKGCNVFVIDSEKNTSLMKSAEVGNVELVKLFIEAGLSPNIKNIYGFTCVFGAILADQPDIIDLLRKYY